MNRVLNATVQRTADHAAPEITLDPLEIVGGELGRKKTQGEASGLWLCCAWLPPPGWPQEQKEGNT